MLADGVACHALGRHVDAIVVVVRLADGREGVPLQHHVRRVWPKPSRKLSAKVPSMSNTTPTRFIAASPSAQPIAAAAHNANQSAGMHSATACSVSVPRCAA